MKTNIINEEIKRAKLLMGYKPDLTLTENESKIEVNEKLELDEQSGKEFVKLFFGKVDDVAASNAGKFTSYLQKAKAAEYTAAKNLLSNVSSKVGGVLLKNGSTISKADDIINAMRAGTISPKGMSDLAKGLMKSGGLKGDLRTKLIQKAADLSIKNNQFANMSEKQIAKALKAKGYASDVADDIANRISKGGSKNPIPINPDPVPLPQPEPWWKERWRNFKYKDALKIAGGIGAGALLYWWMSGGDDQSGFPPCLTKVTKGKGFTETDLKKLEQVGGAYLPMSMPNMVTSEKEPANVADAKFFKDGTFEADGTKGQWQQKGGNIEISHNGAVYFIVCGDLVINNTPPTPAPNPQPGSGCSPASDFPFSFYQMNSMIGKVQSCVGTRQDNCMGPQTAAKIMAFLGLSEAPNQLTKDIYDKVMAKCGGSSTTTKTEPMKEPQQISGGVTTSNKPESSDDFEF
jgi:hypothetical protein